MKKMAEGERHDLHGYWKRNMHSHHTAVLRRQFPFINLFYFKKNREEDDCCK